MKHWAARIALNIFCFLCLYSAEAAPPVFPDSDWPKSRPEVLGVDLNRLEAFADYAFTDTDARRTDSVVVVYRGKIIFERYAHGFHAQKPHVSWSMAKSFAAIVFGIAADQGRIRPSDSLADYFAELAQSPEHLAQMNAVSLWDELSMSAGHDWVEDYTTLGAPDADVVKMLYLDGRRDMAAYAAARPLVDKANDFFCYSTGNSNIVMGALKKKLGADYSAFPWKSLFDRIGMRGVVWEQDASGTFSGGSHVYATARDYARFGLLLLRNGRWNGEQVVSKEWIDRCRTLSAGLATGTRVPKKQVEARRSYGAGFYLNVPVPRFEIPKSYADVPADMYFASGHLGQAIFVIPSLDLVVVRNASDSTAATGPVDWNSFLRPLLEALPDYVSDRSVAPAPLTPYEGEVTLRGVLGFLKKIGTVYSLLGAQRSKDFCSCYFVEGRTQDECLAGIKHGIWASLARLPIFGSIPVFGVAIDESERAVRANGQSARWIGPELGCQLQ